MHQRINNRPSQDLCTDQVVPEALKRSYPDVSVHNRELFARTCHDEDRVLLPVLLERREHFSFTRSDAQTQILIRARQKSKLEI